MIGGYWKWPGPPHNSPHNSLHNSLVKRQNRPSCSRKPPSQASREILDTIEEHLSEDHLLGILAPLVRPLQAEVTELREKIAANAKRNRFEVSLGNIPPELEQKLWERLQEDLAGRVLQQTQEQSAEIFVLTKSVMEEKIATALD